MSEERQYKKFYVDWWRIKKSTLYGIVAVIVFVAACVGGGYWLYSNDWIIDQADDKGPKNSAKIISFQGDVRVIRVRTRKTERVIRETFVQAGDTIQTQADGRAQVRMIDGSMLSIRPRSTVVIRDSRSLFGNTEVRVKLDDGQIRVRTEDQPDNSNNVVEIKQTQNRLAAKTDASFNLNKNEDKGEIRVSRGSITSNSNGVNTTVSGNEFATIRKGRVDSKEKLLPAPSLRTPAPSSQLSGGDISFLWARPTNGSDFKYEFQVSRSPFFVAGKNAINQNLITSTSFSADSLKPGTYFWRVRATAGSGQTTEWSEPSRFTIVKSEKTVSIKVSDWSVEHLGGSLYRVSGMTRAGATVTIARRETFAKADGTFLLQIKSSDRVVGVRINDDEGNSSSFRLNLRTGQTS